MTSLHLDPPPIQPPPDGPVRFPACVWDLYPAPPAVAVESFADELLDAIGRLPIADPSEDPSVDESEGGAL